MKITQLAGLVLLLPIACSNASTTGSVAPRSTPTEAIASATPTGTALPAGPHLAMGPGNVFSPSVLTVKVGDTVAVINNDSAHHTFTDNGVFNSDDLGPGGTFSYHFTTAGTFHFVCSYHEGQGMKGTITVQ